MFFDLIYVIILGIIEGITEWMPISSTAHLVIISKLLSSPFNSDFDKMFDVVIQFGAILAVIILYFKELWPFERNKFNKENINTWKLILISMIPIVILGFIFDDFVSRMFYNSLTIGIAMIFYGILFIILEKNQKKKSNEITPKNALAIGFIQLLAIIPGTSRSGVTIIGSTLLGIEKSKGVKYSFFLSVPIMFGASVLKMSKYLLSYSISFNEVILLLIGVLVAMLVSLLVLKLFMKFINKYTFKVFGIYRILLGILILFFV